MTNRSDDGRYSYADERVCKCGHTFYEHRDSTFGGGDNGSRGMRCDSAEDQSCGCKRFRPRQESQQ